MRSHTPLLPLLLGTLCGALHVALVLGDEPLAAALLDYLLSLIPGR